MSNDSQVLGIIKTTKEFVEKVMVKLTLDVNANLTETTPVDTGWAASNWVPNIGSPYNNSANGVESREEKLNLLSAQLSDKEKGLAEVLNYKLPRGAIHITNNVPYITKLNEGSSSQAPTAFVQTQIERAVLDNGGIRGE